MIKLKNNEKQTFRLNQVEINSYVQYVRSFIIKMYYLLLLLLFKFDCRRLDGATLLCQSFTISRDKTIQSPDL